jgi:type IV pilus assembly protein PilQ
LISSPKITVLDNRPATIISGTKIPFITQTANAGANVRFESAVISITVTPHITADGSVIMNISATRNEPDFGQAVQGNPSIVQREATTEVLVKSGNTTVIGGIYRVNRTKATSGFPFLRSLPIIGYLFKSDNRRLDRQELLIFVTPRIVGDERTAVRQIQG